MSKPILEPPRIATALLKACCSPARFEEIAGDLCEIFQRRSALEGVARARRRYAIDAISVSAKQLAVRVVRALRRPVGGMFELYPLRILACVAFIAVLLLSSQHAWAVQASQVLLCAYVVFELAIYAHVAYSTYKRLRKQPGSQTSSAR